jgi:hypothetical protein
VQLAVAGQGPEDQKMKRAGRYRIACHADIVCLCKHDAGVSINDAGAIFTIARPALSASEQGASQE